MCPCGGFAYGESGDLDLIRTRDQVIVDQLHITPLFENEFNTSFTGAILQRWEPDYQRDFDTAEQPGFVTTVAGRPAVRIMDFKDYNHDGQSTEFYLQTQTVPCAKSAGVVIGVSKNNPSLHVLGTASDTGHPLVMKKFEWEALAKASATVHVTDWYCADHGAEETATIELFWSTAGIDGRKLVYSCTESGQPGQLISNDPL
jgi:hypothetical protein